MAQGRAELPPPGTRPAQVSSDRVAAAVPLGTAKVSCVGVCPALFETDF